MGLWGSFFKRAGRPPSLRVQNGDAFAAQAERLGLTAREAEIVRLVLEGKDGKAISEKLFISGHTVKNHIHHIYQKLGVKNRIQLVRCFQAVLEDRERPPASLAAPPAGAAFVRRAAVPAAVLFLALATVLVAWKPWGRRPRPAALPPPPAVAMLDFENLSNDPGLDKWVMGLPLLLATDLGQSKHLRTLGDDVVYGALRKFDLAGRKRYTREEFRRLAKDMKADYLITGSLMAAGGTIVVTAFVQDARSGETVRTEKLDCADENDLMQKTDGLAALIRSHLIRRAAPVQDDIDLDIEMLTTASALAYKYYSEGWRYHRTGDYEQSLIMLQKAVDIDPGFAMAYRMMSAAARNLRYLQREAEYARKAFELTERLPEDCRERHLIRADYYSEAEATQDLAVAEFQQVLKDHPYDGVANNNLGILCFELEDYEAALRHADVPVRQGISMPFPYYTKAQALWALGRGAEAVRTLTDYHENHPENRLIYQTLAEVLIAGGRLAEAGAVLDKAMATFPDPSWAYWRAGLLFLTEGAAAAREELRRLFLMDEAPWRLRARMLLALIALAGGRFGEAAEECRAGSDLAELVGESGWDSDFRVMLGRILLQEGDPAAAVTELREAVARAGPSGPRRRAALQALGQACVRTGDLGAVEALRSEFQAGAPIAADRRVVRDRDYFLGLLELEGGRPREGSAAMEKAAAALPAGRPPTSQASLIYYHLGLAREKSGDLAGAAAAFERILAPGQIRLVLGETVPLAVLARARVKEAMGDRASAVAAYRSFLEFWAQADPGRPELAEARTRLAALAGPSAPER
jgi:DNA-binding CsgD family transcriptional regulator/tetratricopeptide (TPR) repeat protein